MIRVWGSLILAAVLSYWTVGFVALRVFRDVLHWPFHEADQAAFVAFLIGTPLLWPVVWFAGRLLLEGRGGSADAFGSAAFMGPKTVHAMTEGPGLIVGREITKDGRLIRYDGEAHLLTVAPTRTGKGIGAIIPNLLTAERSVLCVDPKGENARIAARQRRRFGPVWVLDPFDVSGIPSASYNPLDGVDAASPDVAEDAATLAEALVADPPGQVSDVHWNEEAKALLGGLILFVATEEPGYRRNLACLRELLTLAPDAFRDLLKRMQASSAAGGLVARAANRHLGKSDREAAGVLSSAQRHTHFLDSPRMAAVMEHSDFGFAELKERTCSLFLVLPPDRLDAYARWLRLMVAQSLSALARTSARPERLPVLFLLDEFAALGRLEAVERAMGLMAGYGMQLWPILQDLHQLKATYGQRAGTFMSNAGLIQVFNVNDMDTASWVSRTLGDTTEVYSTGSTGHSSKSGDWLGEGTSSEGSAVHLARRALLTPDEVRRLDPDKAILFKAGARPILARKVRYHADPEFGGLFEETSAPIAAIGSSTRDQIAPKALQRRS